MKPVVCVLYLLLPCVLMGQSLRTPMSRRASIGLRFFPALTHRTLSAGADERSLVASRNVAEIHRWGYDAGLCVWMPLTSRLGLESGLGFSRLGYQTRPMDLTWTEANPAFPRSSFTRVNYSFLSIPLKASYSFGRGRWQGVVGGGLITNVFISQQTVVITQSAEVNRSASVKFVGVSRFTLAPVVSIGFQYVLSPTMNLRLEPEFQYVVTPLRPGSAFREHLYASGLQLSLLKRL